MIDLEEWEWEVFRIKLLSNVSIDLATGCWNWKGPLYKSTGYGQVHFRGVGRSAHRLAAALWLGLDLNSPVQANHHCDNPPCFNPQHLVLGTQSDNIRDCVRKGRHPYAAQDRCSKGHLYEKGAVAYLHRVRGTERRCLTCYNTTRAAWRERTGKH